MLSVEKNFSLQGTLQGSSNERQLNNYVKANWMFLCINPCWKILYFDNYFKIILSELVTEILQRYSITIVLY